MLTEGEERRKNCTKLGDDLALELVMILLKGRGLASEIVLLSECFGNLLPFVKDLYVSFCSLFQIQFISSKVLFYVEVPRELE